MSLSKGGGKTSVLFEKRDQMDPGGGLESQTREGKKVKPGIDSL